MKSILITFDTEKESSEALFRFQKLSPAWKVRQAASYAEFDDLRLHFRVVNSEHATFQLAGYTFDGVLVLNRLPLGNWISGVQARCRKPVPPKLNFKDRLYVLFTGRPSK